MSFDHAPAQRAHRLVGHGDAPVLSEVANSSSSRQDAPSRYRVAVPVARSALPRERFSPLALFRPWLDVRLQSVSRAPASDRKSAHWWRGGTKSLPQSITREAELTLWLSP